ncbi:DUF2911 domain-containing protein [Pontibacter diazotrophicus]|uniref:DUF2911 domain-containing protein n=1 Tax=Pontibacter diazotrophicus TaxID=1400979 RepID=A0A3D8LDS9_9BACT|nr:DUF2911 domain-containing protein [Pontibacter diazotrophicus]RDV15550.1 DUF2911 domain-containing protein [Pontibacter diazotrophicus]
MKNTRILNSLALLFVCMLMSTIAWAQNEQKASPPATATGKVGEADITVNYSSPAVKGRQIWGDLVPYGEVWRAGANEATTVTVDEDVMVEGKELPAGTYSLYTIPGEDEWTVIFNKTAKQWGTQYDEGQDALRVTTKPRQAATMNERLAYDVTDQGLVLRWENLEVPVTITAQK